LQEGPISLQGKSKEDRQTKSSQRGLSGFISKLPKVLINTPQADLNDPTVQMDVPPTTGRRKDADLHAISGQSLVRCAPLPAFPFKPLQDIGKTLQGGDGTAVGKLPEESGNTLNLKLPWMGKRYSTRTTP
jgi:hypothetical protein